MKQISQAHKQAITYRRTLRHAPHTAPVAERGNAFEISRCQMPDAWSMVLYLAIRQLKRSVVVVAVRELVGERLSNE